jgi:protease I
MGKLDGKRIAILATDGVEQVELTEPRKGLEEAGATTELIGLQAGEIQGFDKLDHGETFTVDRSVDDATPDDYDGLLIPGGVANGDFLRGDERAVRFTAAIAEAKKPIAAICHAPWILAETGIAKGRTVTSYPTLRTDLENAGARWVDEEVVVDEGLVTSRNPDDIPAFTKKAIEEFCEGPHEDAPQPDGRFAREGAASS